jgi:hypothetical protein
MLYSSSRSPLQAHVLSQWFLDAAAAPVELTTDEAAPVELTTDEAALEEALEESPTLDISRGCEDGEVDIVVR